jgi:glutathione S-transferase
MSKLVLHGFPVSSNTHRVVLLMGLLGLTYENRVVDLAAGEHRGPDFAIINPRHVVPVLEDGDARFTESYAILMYLAQCHGGAAGAALWPADPAAQARIVSWMFFTATELHGGIGLARNERSFGIPSGGDYATQKGVSSLAVLEDHLGNREWLEEGRATLADVAVYPFVAVAGEAGLSLDGRPAIAAWLARLAKLPGFVRMPLLADLRK